MDDFLPLAPRARWLFHLQALSRFFFFWVPACAIGGVVLAWMASPTVGLVTMGCWLFLMFLLALWYPSLAFDRWGYRLEEDELLVARGVFFRSVTAIPRCRIQHVDTHQGPIEQWLRLARVQVYTASGLGADGVIPGVNLETAESLRNDLVQVDGDDGV
jgi:uncharacterized protein